MYIRKSEKEIFCHKKIEKKGQENRLIAQIIWHIACKIGNQTNGIMLNNVNGIKKILINLGQSIEQTLFHYDGIINRWRMKIGKNIGKNLLIIVCIEDNYGTSLQLNVSSWRIWDHYKSAKKN
jgi:hypothetical protein